MTELQQVEREIASYKYQLSLGEMLERLSSNKDFQTLITEGFLRENAIHLVNLLAHPAQQTPEKQAAIHRQMAGIGALNDHFRDIRQKAELAPDSLAKSEDMRTYLLNYGEQL